MDGGTATVLAATITVVGGLLGIYLQKFRTENQKDHAAVMIELKWLRRIIERVEVKHDQHLSDFHLGERVDRTQTEGAKRHSS